MVLVGFNELRGEKLFNSMAVIDRGTLLGTYSKAFPIFDYFEPGRDFPVFRKDELIFGIIICADSSYIEPARILALKGARLIFSPHNNLVNDPLDHALHVRASHTARAVENRVFMLRGNNVYDREDYGRLINHVPHYGYGDSFLLDPQAQCYAGAGMHAETLMIANIDFARYERPAWEVSQSRRSAEALLDTLKDTL
jgi:predicted amidohydrolase